MDTLAAGIMDRISSYILDPAIAVVFTAGLVVFLYGLVEVLWGLNSGKVDEKGKNHMIWGIIGMTIMVSVYGIISLLNNTFGLGHNIVRP